MYYPDERRRSVDRLATELFSERRDHLMRVARRNTRREADAEDALQEALICFLTEYDPGRGSPAMPWLTLTLKRRCWRANERRGSEVDPAVIAEAVAGESADPAVRVGERIEARERLGTLKGDERTGLVMHAAGFTYGEIGERRGWSGTKVNRCLYEGRRALRDGGVLIIAAPPQVCDGKTLRTLFGGRGVGPSGAMGDIQGRHRPEPYERLSLPAGRRHRRRIPGGRRGARAPPRRCRRRSPGSRGRGCSEDPRPAPGRKPDARRVPPSSDR
jgi:DNA-directed RNA polymerase specialized sigma24 family protein